MKKQNNQISVRVDDHLNSLIIKAANEAGVAKADYVRKILSDHFEKSIIIERIDKLERALGNLNFDTVSAIAGLTEGEKEAAKNEVNELYQDEILG